MIRKRGGWSSKYTIIIIGGVLVGFLFLALLMLYPSSSSSSETSTTLGIDPRCPVIDCEEKGDVMMSSAAHDEYANEILAIAKKKPGKAAYKEAFGIVRKLYRNRPVPANVKVALAELNYQIQETRKDEICQSNMGVDHVWLLHTAAVHCESVVRLGALGEGGKVSCGLEALPEDCVVYSFGSSSDVSYDKDMESIYGCETHAFDCTVNYADNPNFHRLCLGPSTLAQMTSDPKGWKFMNTGQRAASLPMIAQELGHKRIDVLKMDIESCEHAFIEWMHTNHPTFFLDHGIVNILIEVHLQRHDCTERRFIERMVRRMHDMGYYQYSTEPNFRYLTCHELGFVSKDYLLGKLKKIR